MDAHTFASGFMHTRRHPRGDTISAARLLLDAMGHCRRALNDAQAIVRPMGTAYHACAMVTYAIDTLASYITAGGSAPAPGVPAVSTGYRHWHEDRLRRGGRDT